VDVLVAARQHAAAARVLAAHTRELAPIGFLAGHACELAMKAYMVHRGDSITGISKRYGHDLTRLLGAVSNVELPKATADCVKTLAMFHGSDQGLVSRTPGSGTQTVELEDIPEHVDTLIAAVAAHLE
jgi:HEPN domain-containing protein